MKQTLTKREKLLLYILLCVIIVVGGIFYLVMPAMDHHSEAKTEHDNAELELMSAKAAIPVYGDLDKEIKEAGKELKAIKDRFYESMNKEDVDAIITKLALDHALVPTNLNISEITEEAVVDYPTLLKQQSEAEKKSEDNKKTNGTMMKVYQISLTMEGSIANLQKLVNDANQQKSLKIASVNYITDTKSEKAMLITFKLFMV